MTGGLVAILGEAGRNIAAGMTGGTLFLYDPDTRVKGHLSADAPAPSRLTDTDAEELRAILLEHVERTASVHGADLLARWDDAVRHFWVLRPEPPQLPVDPAATDVAIDAPGATVGNG